MRHAVQLLIIILLLLVWSNSLGQKQAQAINDSLIKEVNLPRYQDKDDSDKAAMLYRLASGMGRVFKYDEGVKYGEQYLQLTRELNMPQVKGYHLLGILCARKSDYPKALEYFFEALKLYETAKDRKGIEAITGNIGNIFENQGHFGKALEYHLKALKIAEELGDMRAISRNCNNVGNSYGLTGDHVRELEYYFRAMKTDGELGDTGAANYARLCSGVFLKGRNSCKAV